MLARTIDWFRTLTSPREGGRKRKPDRELDNSLRIRLDPEPKAGGLVVTSEGGQGKKKEFASVCKSYCSL